MDAFQDGVLPSPNYTLAKVDFGDDEDYIDSSIADFNEKLKDAQGEERQEILTFLDQLKKAKRAISESEDIPTVISEAFDKPELKTGKFIVFCPAGEDELEDDSTIHRMKSIMKQAGDWFGQVTGIKKIKKYSVYSKLGAKKNHKIIRAFENDDSKSLKLLYSINMLNEGLHVDGIDGIIMLRGTSSRIIYLQQLGRALSVGLKRNPLVLDLVANLNYVNVQEMQKMVTDINKGKGDHEKRDYEKDGDNLDNNEVNAFKLKVVNYDKMQLMDALKNNILIYNQDHNWFEEFYKNLIEWKVDHPNFEKLLSKKCLFRNVVARVRAANKNRGTTNLTQEMIDRLNAIGFPWEADKRDWFEEFYENLLEWKNKYNTFDNLKTTNSDFCPFGQVVVSVRKSKKGTNAAYKLTDEMIQKLDAIGFPWEAKNDWFDIFIENLIEWKIDHPNFEGLLSEDCPFHTTVNRVRRSYKIKCQGISGMRGVINLTDEMIDRLNAIDFPWEAKKIDRFEEFMEFLKKWKIDHPNFEGLLSKECPFNRYVNSLRLAYKGKGSGMLLTQEMIDRLNAIGFPWEGRKKFAGKNDEVNDTSTSETDKKNNL